MMALNFRTMIITKNVSYREKGKHVWYSNTNTNTNTDPNTDTNR